MPHETYYRNRDRRPTDLGPLDIYRTRCKTGMTQEMFARIYGVPLDTLRNWEQGRRQPTGPALMFLHLIAREPVFVRRVLRRARLDEEGIRPYENLRHLLVS